MPTYTYTNSKDFINNLAFDYIETYSFQRGVPFEENRKLIKIEYDKLQIRKEKGNELTAAEEERYEELHRLLGFTQYLLNSTGQFHPSSEKINTFKKDDSAVSRLKDILQTEIIEVPSWMCAPFYRDAIVFYDSNDKIISTLNVCLSCQYMETSMFNHINGDYKTYDLLKEFFIDIGHNVESTLPPPVSLQSSPQFGF